MMEESFTDYALSLSKVDGTYYGWSGAEVDVGQMLYYRKDLFREAGLDPDDPPSTMAELMEAAERWVADIMKCAPLSVRASKEAALLGMDMSIEQDMNVMRCRV